MKFENVSIKGIGSFIPNKVITNKDIEKIVSTTSDEWIFKKLGIKERRVVEEYQKNSDIGYLAAIEAIEDAGLDKEDLDMIIVATSSPEQISPSTACIIHNKLNIKKNIPSFDINAVCSGFVYAITLALPLISSGVYKNILVIASETYSKHTNWSDPHCVFFGDGAGALIVSHSKIGYAVSEISSNGAGTGMTGFNLPLKDNFVMKGKEVWEQAIKVLPNSIKGVLSESNLEINDIKMLIPHQPSINILKIIAEEVKIPMSKVKTVMHKYANIACASIPIALHDAVKMNEVVNGDKILLSAVGSGWTWGSLIIDYKK